MAIEPVPTLDGDLQRFAFPRLLFFLYQRDFTGELRVDIGGKKTASVYFREGLAVFTDLAISEDVLGQILLEQGWISQEMFTESLQRLAQGKMLQGQILLDLGAIDEDTLIRGLNIQLRRKLIRFFNLSNARFKIVSKDHDQGLKGEGRFIRADPFFVAYQGVRNAYGPERLDKELTKLDGKSIQIRSSFSKLRERYGMGPEVVALTTVMMRAPLSTDQVWKISDLSPLETKMLIYTLWITETLAVREASSSHVHPTDASEDQQTEDTRRFIPKGRPKPPLPVGSTPQTNEDDQHSDIFDHVRKPQTLPDAELPEPPGPEPFIAEVSTSEQETIPFDEIEDLDSYTVRDQTPSQEIESEHDKNIDFDDDTNDIAGFDDSTNHTLSKKGEKTETPEYGEPEDTKQFRRKARYTDLEDTKDGFSPDSRKKRRKTSESLERFNPHEAIPDFEALSTTADGLRPPSSITHGIDSSTAPEPIPEKPLSSANAQQVFQEQIQAESPNPAITPPPPSDLPRSGEHNAMITPPPPSDLPRSGEHNAMITPPPPSDLPQSGEHNAMITPPPPSDLPQSGEHDSFATPLVDFAKPEGIAKTKPISAEAITTRRMIEEKAKDLSGKNYFEILDVPRNASSAQIKNAFHELAKQFHSDRIAGLGLADLVPVADQIFRKMNEAQSELLNKESRKKYETALEGGEDIDEAARNALEAEFSFQRGMVCFRKKTFKEALEEFKQAVKLAPNEGEHLAWAAWTIFCDPKSDLNKMLPKLKTQLLESTKRSPKSASCHYFLGEVYLRMDDEKRAMTCFSKALECDKSHIDAARQIRIIRMRKDKGSKRKGLLSRFRKK